MCSVAASSSNLSSRCFKNVPQRYSKRMKIPKTRLAPQNQIYNQFHRHFTKQKHRCWQRTLNPKPQTLRSPENPRQPTESDPESDALDPKPQTLRRRLHLYPLLDGEFSALRAMMVYVYVLLQEEPEKYMASENGGLQQGTLKNKG